MFLGIVGAPCLFSNGVYYFSRMCMNDVISEINCRKSTDYDIPNKKTYDFVSKMLKTRLVEKEIKMLENSFSYAFAIETIWDKYKREYKSRLENIFKIEMISSDANPPNSYNYVWSNRMMNQQMDGKYSILEVNPSEEQLTKIPSENVFIQYHSTLREFERISGLHELDVIQTDYTIYKPLQVGETALIIVPKNIYLNPREEKIRDNEFTYLALSRLE